jgi:YfiH family protein
MPELIEDKVEQPPFVMRNREVEVGGASVSLQYLVCEPLEQAGFRNAFSTREGGVSALPANSLNLAKLKGDSGENIEENRRRFLEAIGASQIPLCTARQTHSVDRYFLTSMEQAEDSRPECDALTSRLRGVLLAIQTADCLPVLIGDPSTGAMAAIHAGWRGTAGRITERTVADLLQQGMNPRTAIAALGPAACAECYEVGDDVIQRYKKEFGYWPNLLGNFTDDGKGHLDVLEANRQQLAFCGFSEDRIHMAEYCTMHQNELFFSYRREGREQSTGVGRLLAVIGRL